MEVFAPSFSTLHSFHLCTVQPPDLKGGTLLHLIAHCEAPFVGKPFAPICWSLIVSLLLEVHGFHCPNRYNHVYDLVAQW